MTMPRCIAVGLGFAFAGSLGLSSECSNNNVAHAAASPVGIGLVPLAAELVGTHVTEVGSNFVVAQQRGTAETAPVYHIPPGAEPGPPTVIPKEMPRPLIPIGEEELERIKKSQPPGTRRSSPK